MPSPGNEYISGHFFSLARWNAIDEDRNAFRHFLLSLGQLSRQQVLAIMLFHGDCRGRLVFGLRASSCELPLLEKFPRFRIMTLLNICVLRGSLHVAQSSLQ